LRECKETERVRREETERAKKYRDSAERLRECIERQREFRETGKVKHSE
jgi:hypothetical protein